MKLSEFIKEAQESLIEFGDLDVVVFDLNEKLTTPVFKDAGIMLAKENENDEMFVFCIADEDIVGSVDDAGDQ